MCETYRVAVSLSSIFVVAVSNCQNANCDPLISILHKKRWSAWRPTVIEHSLCMHHTCGTLCLLTPESVTLRVALAKDWRHCYSKKLLMCRWIWICNYLMWLWIPVNGSLYIYMYTFCVNLLIYINCIYFFWEFLLILLIYMSVILGSYSIFYILHFPS